MRIICPNCDAQYEVPASVIPEEGRDVECSACGKTWYQYHPDHPPAAPQDSAEPETGTELSPAPEPSPTEPADDATVVAPSTPAAAPQTPATAPAADRRARPRDLDPGVADILRAEAAREQAARAAEALEVQTDLNLGPAPAKAQSAPPPPQATPQPRSPAPQRPPEEPNPLREPTSRRELLPDIEEINSTLRSTGDRDAAGGDPAPDAPLRGRQKRSFRRGFVMSVAIVSFAALLYVFAPQITASVPEAEPVLLRYIAAVDDARLWLTGQLTQVTEWLAATAAASGQ